MLSYIRAQKWVEVYAYWKFPGIIYLPSQKVKKREVLFLQTKIWAKSKLSVFETDTLPQINSDFWLPYAVKELNLRKCPQKMPSETYYVEGG